MNFIIPALLLATVHARPNPTPNTGRLHVPRQNQLIPVVVGGPQDTFTPNSLVAAVGDVIQFQFSSGNHTATQSSLEAPCTPLDGGMNSGHIPFADGQADVGTFNVPVASTDPMFVFCATGPHCQEGQVLVVNPANAQQVVDFVKRAQGTDKSVDSTTVAGGSAGKIALANAAFAPPKQQDPAAAPPAGAPPAEAAPPAGSSAPAGEAPSAASAASSTPAVPPAAATSATETQPPAESVPA